MKISGTSPTGWWLAGLLERHSKPDHAPYWNNYRLVRADDWRTAFRRATEMGLSNARVGNEAFSGHQEFLGVSDLVPIYEQFEDGAELLWEELWPDQNDLDGVPRRILSENDLESKYELPPAQGEASQLLRHSEAV